MRKIKWKKKWKNDGKIKQIRKKNRQSEKIVQS